MAEYLQQWTREGLWVPFVWASVKTLTQAPTLPCSLNWREIDLMVHCSVSGFHSLQERCSIPLIIFWATGSRQPFLNHHLQASSRTSKLLNLLFQHEYEQLFLASQFLQLFSEPIIFIILFFCNLLTPTNQFELLAVVLYHCSESRRTA